MDIQVIAKEKAKKMFIEKIQEGIQIQSVVLPTSRVNSKRTDDINKWFDKLPYSVTFLNNFQVSK